MSDEITISALTTATSVGDDDIIPLVQGGVTKGAAASLVASAIAASEILTKIKTVDGIGSGLDADLIDGLHAAAFALVGSSPPVGSVVAFGGKIAPTGWLLCDGSCVEIATYTGLTTAIYIGDDHNSDTDSIYGYKVTNSGGGTRSISGSHIKLPDLRGEFIRGFDSSRGVDSGRAWATAQADDFKSHDHIMDYGSGGNTAGAIGQLSPILYVTEADRHSGATGGTETRPRNVTMNYIIRY